MAEITPGLLNFTQVFRLSEFKQEFDIEDYDVTGKTLLMQVRLNEDAEPVLEFNEDDTSLTKTVESTTKTSVTLLMDASKMDMPIGIYHYTIIAFTSSDDIDTIIQGLIKIVPQYTKIVAP